MDVINFTHNDPALTRAFIVCVDAEMQSQISIASITAMAGGHKTKIPKKNIELQKSFIENAEYSDNINFATALADILNKVNGNRKEWLNKKEVADLLGISCETVRRWCNKGLLPEPDRIPGRNPRWLKSDIDLALKTHKTKVAQFSTSVTTKVTTQ
jgi:predicted DNA-binding transcriptional regulator AlpA